VEEGGIADVVHHPQELKLLSQAALLIQLRIGGAAAAVLTDLTLLGLGSGHHLPVAIKPGQA
jgi:hypothetical protein